MSKLAIRQGKTFEKVFRWGASPILYRAISGMDNSAPVRIHAPTHGLPPKWPIAVMGVAGMTELNSENNPPLAGDFHTARAIDQDYLDINTINAERFSQYAGGGHIAYYTPVALLGYTGVFKIRDRIGGAELYSGSSADDVVTIDDASKEIRIVIPAADTAEFDFKKGVYELELTNAAGYVPSAFPVGKVEVEFEVVT